MGFFKRQKLLKILISRNIYHNVTVIDTLSGLVGSKTDFGEYYRGDHIHPG